MTTLIFEDLNLPLAESLCIIERRAIALGIECERARGYAGNNWLSVRVGEGVSNTLGFHIVDGKVTASMTAHATNDPIAIIQNARKVADIYHRLMDLPEAPPVPLRPVPALAMPLGAA